MASKRSAPYVHPSRHDQVPDEPRRRRTKPNNAGSNSFKKAHPVNELKNQVRSLKRLLERNDDLPADVKVEKERALQSAQHELEETQKAQKRSEMIGRYHKIRFFDRQKATKRLKRARKELQAHEGDDQMRMKLVKAVEAAEVDVNYAQYCPLDQPYVSLFPRKGPEQDVEHDENESEAKDTVVERKGDHDMWQRVKQCMVEDTLGALRNGKLTMDDDVAKDATLKSAVRKEGKKKNRQITAVNGKVKDKRDSSHTHETTESEDEKGEGFFE